MFFIGEEKSTLSTLSNRLKKDNHLLKVSSQTPIGLLRAQLQKPVGFCVTAKFCGTRTFTHHLNTHF